MQRENIQFIFSANLFIKLHSITIMQKLWKCEKLIKSKF